MKAVEKRNLINRIINYCKKYKIEGSFNNKCADKLVSFEVKDKEKAMIVKHTHLKCLTF